MADVAFPVTAGTVEADTGGDVADYVALMKPRVMFLVVFTALVGLVAAPGSMHPGPPLALPIGFYFFVYPMWRKRRTRQNTVIGGAAGPSPPMIGWAAATGGVS